MKRLFIVFLLIINFVSIDTVFAKVDFCDVNQVISPSDLLGAEKNVKIIEKSTQGYLSIITVVPRTISRDQIRPTVFYVLKTIKKKYPYHARAEIYLTPDDESLASEAILIGSASYKEDMNCKATLKIEYGIPTNQQRKIYNSKIGKPIPALFEKNKSVGVNNDIPLNPPDIKLFNTSRNVVLLVKKYSKRDSEAKPSDIIHPALLSDETVVLIAKEMKMTDADVWRYFKYIGTYYSTIEGWGEETINLKGGIR